MIKFLFGMLFGVIVTTIGFGGTVKVIENTVKSAVPIADSGLKTTTTFIYDTHKKESK